MIVNSKCKNPWLIFTYKKTMYRVSWSFKNPVIKVVGSTYHKRVVIYRLRILGFYII